MPKYIKYLKNGAYEYASVKDVGDLLQLKTSSKKDIVSAINELVLGGTGGGTGGSGGDGLTAEDVNNIINDSDIIDQLKQDAAQIAEDIKKTKDQFNSDVSATRQELQERIDKMKSDIQDAIDQYQEDQDKKNKEQAENIVNLGNEASQLKNDMAGTKEDLEGVRNSLENYDHDITEINKSVDTINGVLDTKVNSTEMDAVNGKINKNTTDINQNKKDIQLKASQDSLDLLKGDVSKNTAALVVANDKIEGKVSREELVNDIDDFTVKKANLFTGTREWQGWEESDSAQVVITDQKDNFGTIAEFKNVSDYISLTVDNLKVGETYTISVSARSDKDTDGTVAQVFNIGEFQTTDTKDTFVRTTLQRYYVNFVATDESMTFKLGAKSLANQAHLFLSKAKLETGTKATMWEDNANDSYARIEKNSADVKVLADRVTSTVKKQTETDNKVTQNTTDIAQTAEKVETNIKALQSQDGRITENKAQITATANGLRTEFTQKTNDAIGAITDGGKNLILSSAFQTDPAMKNWQSVNNKVVVKEKNNQNWVYMNQSDLSTDNPIGLTSNYFAMKANDPLVIAFDIIIGDISKLDNKTVLNVSYYDKDNNRVDFKDYTLTDLGIKSPANGATNRAYIKVNTTHDDVVKGAILPRLSRNGEIWMSNFFAKISSISNGDYEVANADLEDIQSTDHFKLEQTAQGLAGKADSSQLNKLSGDLTTLSNNFSTTSAGFQASLSKIDDKVDTNKSATDKSIADTNSALTVAKADIKATADNLSTNYTKTTDEHNYVNSQIKQSADKINLSVASVSDKVDGVSKNVTDNKKDTDSKIAALQVTADGISSTVADKADTSYVDQKANQITSTVGKNINNAVDNIQIGGRNYFSVTNWNARKYQTSNGGVWAVQVDNIEPNTQYIVSTNLAGSDHNATTRHVFVMLEKDEKPSSGLNGVSSTLTRTITTTKDGLLYIGVRLSMGTPFDGSALVKVEKGNKATDWTPAPEDIDSAINNNTNAISKVDQKADSISSTVTNNQNSNNAKFSNLEQNLNGFKSTVYSKSDVDSKVNTINGDVNKKANSSDVNNQLAKKADVSQITQLSDRINLKVSQTDFDSSIEHRNYLTNTYDTVKGLSTTNSRGYMTELQRDITGFATGKTLTYSMWHKASTHTGYLCVQVDGTSFHSNTCQFNSYEWLSVTFSVPKDVKEVKILGFIYGEKFDGTNTLDYKREKLEIGKVATDWSPSPEDAAKKNNLVSQINIDKSGVLIQGKKVHITGDTTIDNASIDGAKIKNATIGNAQITGTLSGKTITGSTVSAVNGNVTSTLDKDGIGQKSTDGHFNLIKNSEFMIGASTWSLMKGAYTTSIDPVIDGSNRIAIFSRPTTPLASGWLEIAACNPVKHVAGRKYSASIQMLIVNDDNGATVKNVNTSVEFFNSSFQRISNVNMVANLKDYNWQYKSVTNLTPPAGTAYVGMKFFVQGPGVLHALWTQPYITPFTTIADYEPDTIASDNEVQVKNGYVNFPINHSEIVPDDWINFDNVDAKSTQKIGRGFISGSGYFIQDQIYDSNTQGKTLYNESLSIKPTQIATAIIDNNKNNLVYSTLQGPMIGYQVSKTDNNNANNNITASFNYGHLNLGYHGINDDPSGMSLPAGGSYKLKIGSQMFDGGGSIYTGGTQGWYMRNHAGDLVTVNAAGFYKASTKESKKNIAKADNNQLALDIYNMDITTYNYKQDDSSMKDNIGAVIGDGYNIHNSMLSDENDAIKLDNVLFALVGTVQKQAEQISELTARLTLQELK